MTIFRSNESNGTRSKYDGHDQDPVYDHYHDEIGPW
jgi:hypothetical protein